MDTFAASWAHLSFTMIVGVLVVFCVGAVWFYGYAIYAAVTFFRHPTVVDADFHPPITILKPVCGLENGTYENLASFCCQDYPEYQVVFAVRDRHDPAVGVIQTIIRNFPTVNIRLLINDRTIGTNLKVSNLANAATVAQHPILLLADSDIRVGPDYLRHVVQPLRDPAVGVVTCLYRSLTQGWVTTLEALGTATEFHAGVLVARNVEGMNFALGSTIVIRKAALDAIGGFNTIADYLADDFQLGRLPTQHGYTVVLSDYVVEHVLTEQTIASSILRQIRWARGTRVCQPWGYLGLIFTYGTITSPLLLLLTGGALWSWVAVGLTWFVRLFMAWVLGVKLLQDPAAKSCLWLVPLRDLLSFGIWVYSFLGNSIEWRGQQLKLDKGGKLVPMPNNRRMRAKLTA